jgi:hypothetical protein
MGPGSMQELKLGTSGLTGCGGAARYVSSVGMRCGGRAQVRRTWLSPMGLLATALGFAFSNLLVYNGLWPDARPSLCLAASGRIGRW